MKIEWTCPNCRAFFEFPYHELLQDVMVDHLKWHDQNPAALLRQDGHGQAEGTPAKGEGENTSEQ